MGARGRWQRPNRAKLKPVKKYRLNPGQAGIYQDGAIHSIDYPDNARFVRVTGTIWTRSTASRSICKPAKSTRCACRRHELHVDGLLAVTAPAVKAMLQRRRRARAVDVREELIYSQNHLLWARNVPLSRLELRFARLVPRKATRIVLCDDDDGLAERAARVLAEAGYTDISYLKAACAAGKQPDCLFSGMHVPSKAFGEFIEHEAARRASRRRNSTR